ncbi:MAG: hypothetical protein AAF311_01275, partial [Pseudomonadota bacterium]
GHAHDQAALAGHQVALREVAHHLVFHLWVLVTRLPGAGRESQPAFTRTKTLRSAWLATGRRGQLSDRTAF